MPTAYTYELVRGETILFHGQVCLVLDFETETADHYIPVKLGIEEIVQTLEIFAGDVLQVMEITCEDINYIPPLPGWPCECGCGCNDRTYGGTSAYCGACECTALFCGKS